MPRAFSDNSKRSRFTAEDIKGRVLAIPGIDGIKWYVPEVLEWSGDHVTLITSGGHTIREYYNSIKDWLDSGELVITDEQPEELILLQCELRNCKT